jgi:type IV secretory pathway VirJ component
MERPHISPPRAGSMRRVARRTPRAVRVDASAHPPLPPVLPPQQEGEGGLRPVRVMSVMSVVRGMLVVLAVLGSPMMRASTAQASPATTASATATATAAAAAAAERVVPLDIRGHQQSLHVSGPPDGDPIVVSSGDGGWMHLGPQVASFLANQGYFVVGFDARAYLASFTTWNGTGLRPEDEPGDYARVVAFAARATGRKVLLVGVSEGAGLSVLAATDPTTRRSVRGVIGLGLGDVNELAWRWRDAVIYITKGIPHEPTFSAKSIVHRVAPVPLAMIHSSRDEYVPVTEAAALIEQATEPKRLWVVPAADHRFSNNRPAFERAVSEALQWIRGQEGDLR